MHQSRGGGQRAKYEASDRTAGGRVLGQGGGDLGRDLVTPLPYNEGRGLPDGL